VTRFWQAYAELIRKHYVWVLLACLIVTIVLATGVPRLRFKTTQDELINSSSQVYQDSLRFQRQFGGEPIIVLFEGDIGQLFVEPNLSELRALDAELNDLVGTDVSDENAVLHSVLSPLTVLEFGIDQVALAFELAPASLQRQQEAAATQEEADRLGEEFAQRIAADAARLAGAGEPGLDNPDYVDFVIFDENGAIRPELKAAFADPQHALMIVRLNGNMSIDAQANAAAAVVERIEAHEFAGFDILPSGPVILLQEINDTMRQSIFVMGALAVVAMLVLLFLVYRARWRLLSLGVVLVGNIWAFGLMGYLDLSLTLVTISGLPILIGVGVDFAIQMHSRFEEELERTGSAAPALRSAMVNLAPGLTAAVIAAIVGFLALQTSDVPMVRDFGLMLAIGISVLFVAGLTLPPALLFWRDRNADTQPPQEPSTILDVERLAGGLTSGAQGMRIIPVLAIGVLFIATGLWADQRIKVETDVEKWISQDSPVLKDLRYIGDTAGSSSELSLLIEAPDVLTTEVLEWMADFGARQMTAHPAALVTNASMGSIVSAVTRGPPVEADAVAILPVMPPAIADGFVSEDRTKANMIFAIGTGISLGERAVLLDEMQAGLNPPDGVTVTSAGLAVIGIETADAFSSNRTRMTYVALIAVLIWLLIYYRNIVKMVLPLVPTLIAVGLSSTVIYALGITMSPLTALSGPLIVATCTEFSVLLMARYFEERAGGLAPNDAIAKASLRVGRPFTAAGLTTVAGFIALAFSGFPLLTDFGLVTAVSVGVALISTLVVLPPLLVLADQMVALDKARAAQ